MFYFYIIYKIFFLYYVAEWQVFCIFKSLNKDPQDQYRVNKEAFLRFYEVLDFRWSQVSCLPVHAEL